MSDKLLILSVNVGRRQTLEGILQSTPANILLVQEPPWFDLTPTRPDTDPDGVITWSTCRNSMWECYSPPGLTRRPRVATFIKSDLCLALRPNVLLDNASYTFLPLSLSFPSHALLLLNFYHHVTDHSPNFESLFSFPISADIPTIISGDFNTHSPTWSPIHTRPSPWHHSLEQWLDENTPLSLVPADSVTRRADNASPLCIDFIFENPTGLDSCTDPTCSVSFNYSAGSDNAGLLPLELGSAPPPSQSILG